MRHAKTPYTMLAGIALLVGGSVALGGQSREIAPITSGIKPKVVCSAMAGRTCNVTTGLCE